MGRVESRRGVPKVSARFIGSDRETSLLTDGNFSGVFITVFNVALYHFVSVIKLLLPVGIFDRALFAYENRTLRDSGWVFMGAVISWKKLNLTSWH